MPRRVWGAWARRVAGHGHPGGLVGHVARPAWRRGRQRSPWWPHGALGGGAPPGRACQLPPLRPARVPRGSGCATAARTGCLRACLGPGCPRRAYATLWIAPACPTGRPPLGSRPGRRRAFEAWPGAAGAVRRGGRHGSLFAGPAPPAGPGHAHCGGVLRAGSQARTAWVNMPSSPPFALGPRGAAPPQACPCACPAAWLGQEPGASPMDPLDSPRFCREGRIFWPIVPDLCAGCPWPHGNAVWQGWQAARVAQVSTARKAKTPSAAWPRRRDRAPSSGVRRCGRGSLRGHTRIGPCWCRCAGPRRLTPLPRPRRRPPCRGFALSPWRSSGGTCQTRTPL